MSDHNQKKVKSPKGILKSASSIDEPVASERKPSLKEDIKWDEMNILATLHPENKDYGHIKVDEPKTPYPYDMELQNLDPDQLAYSLAQAVPSASHDTKLSPKHSSDEEEDSDDEDESHHDPAFETKRRAHYNEYQAVKLAKSLLAKEIPVDPETISPTSFHDDEDGHLKEAALNAKRNTQALKQQQKQQQHPNNQNSTSPQLPQQPSHPPNSQESKTNKQPPPGRPH